MTDRIKKNIKTEPAKLTPENADFLGNSNASRTYTLDEIMQIVKNTIPAWMLEVFKDELAGLAGSTEDREKGPHYIIAKRIFYSVGDYGRVTDPRTKKSIMLKLVEILRGHIIPIGVVELITKDAVEAAGFKDTLDPDVQDASVADYKAHEKAHTLALHIRSEKYMDGICWMLTETALRSEDFWEWAEYVRMTFHNDVYEIAEKIKAEIKIGREDD